MSVIKICEQCFLCRSIIFCKTYTKCPKCCTKSACRGQTEPITFLIQTKLDQITHNHQLLFTSSQGPLPVGGITSADKQICSRVGLKSRISDFLQPAIFGPKTKQQMETYTRSEQSQQIPQGRKIQNGDTRNDPDLPTDRGVGHIHRFRGHLLPHTKTKPIKKIPEISCTGQNIPIQSTTIWPVHHSCGVHCSDQRGQTDFFTEGYNNPPVPIRLVVWARSHQTCLQHTQTLVALCQDLGWKNQNWTPSKSWTS